MARDLQELKRFKQILLKRRTPAEVLLEDALRKRHGRFKSQKIIGFYIVDFFSRKRSLIIELDGSIHDLPEQKVKDAKRTEFFKEMGLEIIRFRNHEIISDIDKCVDFILANYPVKKQLVGSCSKAAHAREKALKKSSFYE